MYINWFSVCLQEMRILSKEVADGGKQSCRRSCAVFSLVKRWNCLVLEQRGTVDSGTRRSKGTVFVRHHMEKHVHSILAKDFQRKKRKTHKPITNKNTHKHRQVTLHTNEKGKAGPWVPSLENWGGRLKSLLWAQLSLHTQCPNLPMTANS